MKEQVISAKGRDLHICSVSAPSQKATDNSLHPDYNLTSSVCSRFPEIYLLCSLMRRTICSVHLCLDNIWPQFEQCFTSLGFFVTIGTLTARFHNEAAPAVAITPSAHRFICRRRFSTANLLCVQRQLC